MYRTKNSFQKLLEIGFSVFNDKMYEDITNHNAVNMIFYADGIVTVKTF